MICQHALEVRTDEKFGLWKLEEPLKLTLLSIIKYFLHSHWFIAK